MRRQVLGLIGGLCAGLLVIGFIYVIASIRNTQLEGTPTGKRLLAASDRILDCTEADGECYQKGQKQTAKAVGDINRVVILASACSVGLDPKMPILERQTVIQNCVIQRLAAQRPQP